MALGITPVEINGATLRTQDFSAMKSAEVEKPNVDQLNYQTVIDQNTDNKANTVTNKDNAAETESDSGSGHNAYSGDGGQNRKKKKPLPGKVVVKSKGGFDISI